MAELGIATLLGGTFTALIGLASFVLSLVLGVYIYRDANSRNLNGTLWLLIVITSWLVGVIVYFIVRNDNTSGNSNQYM